MRKLAILTALACIAYAMTGCANQDGTSKLDPAAVAIAAQVLEIGAAEYARQHPAPREIQPDK